MAINAKFIYQMFVAAFCLLTIIVFCYVLGASELAVQKAKAEITRLIKEELIRLQNSYQPTNKGRYKVL
ncbi:hypothetical protein AB205_0039140 [Aquarana catesbeiana]|uniref:Uncharacterized protein n=1 Tax=Aquarana catesbeiana TaxID=8400 RepID=A0A2G9SL48_AQUCT|nr:hypothetical protein AB205_0039140 [Aquarana catesbeiana]